MDAYWDPDLDNNSNGTLVPVFDEVFRHFCRENERTDIVGTSNSAIIQRINEIPKWRHLRSIRPSGDAPRPRYYRVKFKSNVKLPEQLSNKIQALEIQALERK